VDARASLVWVLMSNWDWAAAETEAQHALASDPTNSRALQAAGYLSLTLGRWDAAERHFRAALARDPLDLSANRFLGDVYYRTVDMQKPK
jgi:Flp pilus assembly protein TadD